MNGKKLQKWIETTGSAAPTGLEASLPQPPTGANASQFNVIASIDGWIPAAQFTGSSLEDLARACSWVYAACVGNARAMGSLPPVIQTQKSDGTWERSSEDFDDLKRLVKMPFGMNPAFPRWGWRQLVETYAWQNYLAGNTYLRPAKVDNDTRLEALYLFQKPLQVTAAENEAGGARYYKYGGQKYAPETVVNIQSPNPGSLWKGLAPIQVAFHAMDTDAVAAARQQANMKNAIGIGLVIAPNGPWGSNEVQREQILTQVTRDYQKAVDHGKPWVLGGGADMFKAPSADELQYFDTRRFSRDELLAVIGMPPPMAGVYDNATLANFATARSIWWEQHLFPVLETFYDAINAQAIWPIYGENVRLWYSLTGSDIAIQLLAGRADAAQKLVNLGYPTNWAARAAGLDMPEHPALEEPNQGQVIAGRTEPEPSSSPSSADDDPQDAPIPIPTPAAASAE